MSFNDFEKRHQKMRDDFDASFAKTTKVIVGVAIFWGAVIVAVLGLAAYVVLSLV